MYAMLGEVRFETLQGFGALESHYTAHFAKHEVLQGKPHLQAMGNELSTLRLEITLHWRLGDVDAAFLGLLQAQQSQQAQALVYGSGRFAGWYVLTDIAERMRRQDPNGRTAVRELTVELTEFAGDPNNPLPTPAVMSGKQNPLLSMLPESVRGQVSPIVEKVQTAVKVYRTVEKEVGQLQQLVYHAKELRHDPAGALHAVSDALNIGSAALGKLNGLPEVTDKLGNLAGVATFAGQTAQATAQLGNAVGLLRQGVASRQIGAWLDNGITAADQAADSLQNGAGAVETLTAWLAMRKDGQ